jgi:hypothetical protein
VLTTHGLDILETELQRLRPARISVQA